MQIQASAMGCGNSKELGNRYINTNSMGPYRADHENLAAYL